MYSRNSDHYIDRRFEIYCNTKPILTTQPHWCLNQKPSRSTRFLCTYNNQSTRQTQISFSCCRLHGQYHSQRARCNRRRPTSRFCDYSQENKKRLALEGFTYQTYANQANTRFKLLSQKQKH
ncbi:hypothetical protein LXL04_007115 [Taraxacum kok-saghyz]